jgi:hypothetical protein
VTTLEGGRVITRSEVVMVIGRGRSVRDEGDAKALLMRWKKSGLSMQAWCNENGVARHSLQWWRPRIEAMERSGGLLRVAEVVLPAPTSTGFRLRLPNGVEVGVPEDFHADALARLLTVVSS